MQTIFSKAADYDSLEYVDDGSPNSYAKRTDELIDSFRQSFFRAADGYKSQLAVEKAKLAAARNVSRYPQRRKEAAVVGGPNHSELERAFAQIAETYITDKAPLLTNYMLGFQLLKKTDDDTKACGIFAYKVGDELVYIPVFLINGDIQGHELMYVVSLDRFVPSDEKWVNYLLSRKPLEPGRIELRDRSEIPSRGTMRPTYRSSGLKLGSYGAKELPPLAPELALDAIRRVYKRASVGTPGLERAFWAALKDDYRQKVPCLNWKTAAAIDLDPRTLFTQSYRAVKLAEVWSRDFPVFGRLLDYVMDGGSLSPYLREWEKRAAVAKSLGVVPKSKPTLQGYLDERVAKEATAKPVLPKEGTVAVYGIDKIAAHQFRFLPTAAIDRIHADGYYVADTRDQEKLAGIIEKQDSLLYNPSGPGLYKVFMANGTFRDCFVLRAVDPTTEGVYGSNYFILDKTTGSVRKAPSNHIWVADRDPAENWISKLPASDTSPKQDARSIFDKYEYVKSILVTPQGDIWESRFDSRGDSFMEEDYDRSVLIRPVSETFQSFQQLAGDVNSDISACEREDRLRGGPVIAPKGTVLRHYKEQREPGDFLTIGSRQLWFSMLVANTLPVVVRKRSGPLTEYIVDQESPRMKSASLELLMLKHNLSCKTAEYLLAKADEAGPQGVTVYREKTAFSGQTPFDTRYSVTFPVKEPGFHQVTGVNTESDLDTEEIVEVLRATRVPDEREMWPGLWDSETNQSGSPPAPNTGDMQLASQASLAGQKDFVSSQMLMTLLREIDNDDLLPKYIHTFEKALDTLGRLYIQLLWRTDAFEERFGQTQLKEFKDMLISLFQQMGDFICYIRQRDVRPAPVLSLSSSNPISFDEQ